MKRKLIGFILSGIVLLNFSDAFAQNYAETALMFSRTKPGGSARILGMGGTQVALGGDFSSAGSNPAGLGMFNRSEFTFSAGMGSYTTTADYLGNNGMKNDRSVLSIPGLSLVWHIPQEKNSFHGGAFAITMSRTNDFNRAVMYRGYNPNNSIIDYFINQANGNTTEQFDEDGAEYNTPTGLAYFNYLIGARSILNPPGPDDEYFTDATYPTQQEEMEIKGSTNQWNISYGGNIGDKFFFGAGLGISSLRYKSQKIFTESFNSDTLEFMQLQENLEIRGSGVNFTLGAIARPLDFLQVGMSLTTPTFYNLSESYAANMATIWNNFDYYGDGSEILGDNTNDPVGTDLVTSEYNLRTPMKFGTGIAFISKFGLISADAEFVNYSRSKYSADAGSYAPENDDIKALYQDAMNFRIGGEFRYESYRVRMGYSLQGKTFKSNYDVDNSITTLSGGLGYRTKDYYIDFTLFNSTTPAYFYQPYTFSDGSGPVARFKDRQTTGLITVGFIF